MTLLTITGVSTSLTRSSVNLVRLVWVAPLTVLASIAAVLAVRLFAVALVHPPPEFTPLGIDSAVVLTGVLVTCAVLVFVLVARFTATPIRTFQTISIGALLLSFVPDLVVPRSHTPGANWPAAVALMTMHVAAWGVCVVMLTKLTRSDR
jgi:hypothetical protein